MPGTIRGPNAVVWVPSITIVPQRGGMGIPMGPAIKNRSVQDDHLRRYVGKGSSQIPGTIQGPNTDVWVPGITIVPQRGGMGIPMGPAIDEQKCSRQPFACVKHMQLGGQIA